VGNKGGNKKKYVKDLFSGKMINGHHRNLHL